MGNLGEVEGCVGFGVVGSGQGGRGWILGRVYFFDYVVLYIAYFFVMFVVGYQVQVVREFDYFGQFFEDVDVEVFIVKFGVGGCVIIVVIRRLSGVRVSSFFQFGMRILFKYRIYIIFVIIQQYVVYIGFFYAFL